MSFAPFGVDALHGGAILGVGTTSKYVTAQANTSGAFILAITDTAKTLFYPCVVNGKFAPIVGPQLTTANYD